MHSASHSVSTTCTVSANVAHGAVSNTQRKLHSDGIVIRAARCAQRGSYVLLLFLSFLFFFLFSARSPRSLAAKLCHMIGNGCNFKKLGTKFRGPPHKNLGPKNMLFIMHCRSIFIDVDRAL